MQALRGILWSVAAIGLMALGAGLITGRDALWQPAAVTSCIAVALALRGSDALRGYQFTAWITVAVVAAMIYPERFLHIGTLDLRNPWLILFVVQSVMFGMGTQMSLRDFATVLKMPWGVLVGILCQFTVMPLLGFALTKLFRFPNEVAAGVILIGCCSSGLASNVMTYLARANLPLSIALTAVATLLAPLMTPLWMKLLAGALVEVSFLKMMMDILKIVVLPIGAALLHDGLKTATTGKRRAIRLLAIVAAGWLVYLAGGGWGQLQSIAAPTSLPWISTIVFLGGAVLIGVIYHEVVSVFPTIDRWMPRVSMFGIVYFTAVTTAAGRNELLQVGMFLFLAAVIHNSLGYIIGYWLSRALGMDRESARTIAFEVGLQNGGMASGLAGAMGKLGTVGLAAAVFSPWMNISGSILANYWRKRQPQDEAGDDHSVK